MTVFDVLRTIVRHPIRELIGRWNWKAALLSAAMRGAIFFFANLGVSREAAVDALLVDLSFRLPLVGVVAALTQAFRRAEPAWAATMTAAVLVPAFAHSIEFVVHWSAGTAALGASIAASIAFSVLSTLFNLFAMRRGVLVVGEDTGSLVQDLRRMPSIVVQFVTAGPVAAARMLARAVSHCGR